MRALPSYALGCRLVLKHRHEKASATKFGDRSAYRDP